MENINVEVVEVEEMVIEEEMNLLMQNGYC